MHRVAIFALLLLTSGMAVKAQSTIDLHHHWDQRCRDCHGDSGAFARRSLTVAAGKLQGAHHRNDLDKFLRHHYLADDLVVPVMAMLTAQALTAATFKNVCAKCHGSAAELARTSLNMQGKVLMAQQRGQPVAQVLRSHGGLDEDAAAAMVQTLRRVHGEVAGATTK